MERDKESPSPLFFSLSPLSLSLSVSLSFPPHSSVCMWFIFPHAYTVCLTQIKSLSPFLSLSTVCYLITSVVPFRFPYFFFFLFHTWILVLVSRLHESFLTVMVSLFCPANLYLVNTWGIKSVKYLCGRGTMWLLYLNFISLSSWSCCHILLWINIHIHLLLQQETLSRQPHSLCAPPSWPALCTCVSLMNRQ